ncbi:MAG: NACHT domain-containing protein, partial [Cyanobacteria bacterium J06649_5]
MTDWSRYLESVCEDYAQWWEAYTLTNVTGRQQQAPASRVSGLLLNLRAKAVPEKAEDDKQKGQQAEKIEQFTVLEGLRKYAKGHVLLQGAPGSGKSTAMERLLLEEAQRARDSQLPNRVVAGSRTVTASNATVVDQKALAIPVLVELRYYDQSLQQLIEDSLQRRDSSLDIGELDQWLSEGRLLLLLDGVNELPSSAARKDVQRFQRLHLQLFTNIQVAPLSQIPR